MAILPKLACKFIMIPLKTPTESVVLLVVEGRGLAKWKIPEAGKHNEQYRESCSNQTDMKTFETILMFISKG